ncbi:glycosyltransferase family 4 protein [Paralimibaculum aggregatum]|uniref:Glycosyltransferase family 4 protein n=1 Tax=Paralimibaculum aggregatum TaxID=3036245 RepID=A0ABQ6LI71_9RHOB|nr:glycosyltransferase [Limibaculum sp. NKW23]GMG82984.1 glycosyltransferase family 4 protein [Limibaculum sp. NKW23]
MPAPKILFVHTNFPAQFGFLGQRLAAAGWETAFATARANTRSEVFRILPFEEGRGITRGIHPYLGSTERAVIKGQMAARAFYAARKGGYRPDIVMAHSGWGAGLFAKDVWPDAVFIPYLEWWYNYPPVDSGFLGDFRDDEDNRLRQRVRNTPLMTDIVTADAALAPTRFQAGQFPEKLRRDITVIHDGVDTETHAPAPERPAAIGALDISAMPEIVTYATRGMEPQRGFPEFMRALEILQARRPRLHAIIVGEDRVAYGRRLPEGDSWKKRMLAECRLDPARTHFTGHLPRPDYLAVLQASDAHVYLTVPFVLSWSMLEAMSAGCALVAADVAPVREFVGDGETGRLVPFHEPAGIAAGVEEMLDDRALARRLGVAARAHIREAYDLERVFAEKKAWLEGLIGA